MGTFRKNDCQRLVGGALAESPRGDQAGKAEHMIGVAMRDREDRRREDVGAERDLQAFTGIDQQLQRPVPQPVGIHAAAETAHRFLHLTLLSVLSCERLSLPDFWNFIV